MAGRKTKYTPETVNKIVTALSVGMTDKDACVIGGISHETFYSWINTKAEFSERATRAREEGWQGALAVIKQAAIRDRDWRAAGDYLDRTKSAYRKSVDVNLNIRARAERIAADLGLSVDDVLAEAELIVAGLPRS